MALRGSLEDSEAMDTDTMPIDVTQHLQAYNSWITTEDAINNVFLPRRLPEKSLGSCNGSGSDPKPLSDFNRIAGDFLPPDIRHMMRLWSRHYDLEETTVRQCLTQLEDGATFPVHLVEQNVALTFTRSTDKAFIIRGYQIQPEMEVVTTATSPLFASHPCLAIQTPDHIATSEPLARQLAALQVTSFLKQTIPYEAKSPAYVFEWLSGTLLAAGQPVSDSPHLEKKLRDVVNGSADQSGSGTPWRRLPVWLALKAVLHSELVIRYGLAAGTVTYKTAMLRFMLEFVRQRSFYFDHDMACQMLAKISRRMCKLEALLEQIGNDQRVHKLRETTNSVLETARDEVEKANKALAKSWSSTAQALNDQRPASKPLQVPSARDLRLPLNISREKLGYLLKERQYVATGQMPATKRKHASEQDLISLASGGTVFSEVGTLHGMHNFEKLVFGMWSNPHKSSSPGKLKGYVEQYTKAMEHAKLCQDPIGMSRAMLCGAVLTALCDQQTLKEYPLLAEHPTDIDPGLLSFCLTTDTDQMVVLSEVQEYFSQRNESAKFGTGPLEKSASPSSISVRYAKSQPEMISTRDAILERDQAEEQAHLQRAEREMQRMAADEKQLARMDHDQYRRTIWCRWTHQLKEICKHDRYCRKCKFEKELNQRSLSIFQPKLPEDADLRLAAVFEARIPTGIATWRDTIYRYWLLLLQLVKNNNTHRHTYSFSGTSCTLWRNHLSGSVSSPHVAMGSTKAAGNPSKRIRWASLASSFVQPCPLNFTLCAGTSVAREFNATAQDFKSACSLKINQQTLEEFAIGCDHQQSEVIARQSECPAFFSPQEFIAFGSLRAGERLQWLNIMRGIHQRTLVLSRPEVAQLLCQAVWQSGRQINTDALRNAHQPCCNPAFVQDFHDQLDHVIEATAENWQRNWTLTATVVLANRLFDIYASLADARPELVKSLGQLLLRCRGLACQWLVIIRQQLKEERQTDISGLQHIAFNVAMAGMLTYQHGSQLVEDENSSNLLPLQQWLRLVTHLRRNTPPSGRIGDVVPLEKHLSNMTARITADRHNELLKMITDDSTSSQGIKGMLTSFVKEIYSNGECVSYSVDGDNLLLISLNWRTESGNEECIEIDVHQGDFCIGGQPQGNLPVSVTSHSLVKKHFPGLVLTVQPYTDLRSHPGYISEQKFAESRFVFSHPRSDDKIPGEQTSPADCTDDDESSLPEAMEVDEAEEEPEDTMNGPVLQVLAKISTASSKSSHQQMIASVDNSQLHVYEVVDGRTFQLLPSDWFQRGHQVDVPQTILDKHSIWLEVASRKLFFRPLTVSNTGFGNVADAAFVLDLHSSHLEASSSSPPGVPAQAVLISPSSRTGRPLLSLLAGLELPKYIELWHDGKARVVLARLPRLGLSFMVRLGKIMVLESMDYKGWKVDTDQQLGALLGLRDGLIMVKNRGRRQIEQRCVLIPHGKLVTSKQHVAVVKHVLFKPSVFRYELDRSLRQLTGPFSQTAWLYLACLHACTATVHTEDFTGLTGMEAAMNILRSARCCSTQPYDEAANHALRTIASLSPKRSFRKGPKHLIEVVGWPSCVSSLCASDVYAIGVRQLIQYSKGLSFLHPSGPESCSSDSKDSPPAEKRESLLVSRNEAIHRSSYPVIARFKSPPPDWSANGSTQAFRNVWKPNLEVMRIVDAILCQSAKLEDCHQYTLEAELLRDTRGSFCTDLYEQRLPSVEYWHSLEVASAFLSLHEHVIACRDKDRVHLAFLLSYLAYQSTSSTSLTSGVRLSSRGLFAPQSSTSQQRPLLVRTLAALCNVASNTEPPSCRSFPSPATSLSSVAQLHLAHLISADDYESSRVQQPSLGLFGVDKTSERYKQYESDLAGVRARYQTGKAKARAAIESDYAQARTILDKAPFGYGAALPSKSVPAVNFHPENHDCFDWTEYEESFTEQMHQENLSKIFSSYVSRIVESIQGTKMAQPADVLDHEVTIGGSKASKLTRSAITVNYCISHGQDSTFAAFQSRWSPREAGDPCDVCEELVLVEKSDEGLQQLQEVLDSGSKNDPIVLDFSADLKSSSASLNAHVEQMRSQPAKQPVSKGRAFSRSIESRAMQEMDCTENGWSALQQRMHSACASRNGTSAMAACGLTHRCHPLSIYPQVLITQAQRKAASKGCELVRESFSKEFVCTVGGLMVAEVARKRWVRMIRLLYDDQKDWFEKEHRNTPHSTWKPCDHPEWVVFELENDLCIRAKQVEVALQMMRPSDSKHAVMQLNMGEGKTSVIMPIIAAKLADGDALVRLIVLTSLFNTNYNQLIFKLGGLLNRRILTLPFHRDVPLSHKCLVAIQRFLGFCRDGRGVLVTVREHLLSMQLKYLESCYRQNSDRAETLSDIMSYLSGHARDVIDEADEVLHHRFQLIYPIGVRRHPDGKETRWQVMELVLGSVKNHAERLWQKFPSAVSYKAGTVQSFPGIRMLGSVEQCDAYAWLSDTVASDFICGRGTQLVGMKSEIMDEISQLSQENQDRLKRFILNENLPQELVDWFHDVIPSTIHHAILCLRGILANGVLLLALQKRYRVEYGLLATTNNCPSPDQPHIRLAVPFRAKDVAAERTEFGHTDVAIGLTLLSYYQHGLTNKQIEEVFDRLERKDTGSRNAIYSSWTESAQDVHPSVHQLNGVNRRDKAAMKKYVYPLLQFHAAAINFYLNELIFPFDAREFPEKLVSNAWTLVPDTRSKPVTGFSGTNDTRHLLPATTSQRDLPLLQYTNAHVCKLVLSSSDDEYRVLPAQCTGQQLLVELQDRSKNAGSSNTINTLIDAGAVVLDLTNSDMAKTWLSMRPKMKAVVYFDESNRLSVISKQDQNPVRLELSPFAEDLSDCLVYLDHSHCRGTDLRMVMDTRAAVTLGKGLRRDELVQACMRMRRLGVGHTLSFFAPPEVDRLIREQCRLKLSEVVKHVHVLQWCFLNSIEATKSGFYSWASQGMSHLHVQRAERNAVEPSRLSEGSFGGIASEPRVDTHILGRECALPDSMTLQELYGQARGKHVVADIVAAHGRRAGLPGADVLVATCKKFVPELHRFSHKMDEEQEREMEQETEQERELGKPPRAKHQEETCPNYLRNLVRTADPKYLTAGEECDACPLWSSLENTSLHREYKAVITSHRWNHSLLLATKSFKSTVSDFRPGHHSSYDLAEESSMSDCSALSSQHDPVLQSTLHHSSELKGPSNFIDNFLRPVEWLLVVRHRRATKFIILCPVEANELLATNKWSKSVSLHLYASPLHPRQQIMADWATAARGQRLLHIQSRQPSVRSVFAEILCYSGGLYFGSTPSDRQATMEDLCRLLDLYPGPSATDSHRDAPVRWKGQHASQFPEDPSLLVRALLKLLRPSDCVDLSHMGALLLRHSWPAAQVDDAASCEEETMEE